MTTNKNRNMNTHFIKNLALVVAGLLMTISCSGNTGTKEKKVMEKNAKARAILVPFIHHSPLFWRKDIIISFVRNNFYLRIVNNKREIYPFGYRQAITVALYWRTQR